ncbi:MAG: DUF1488 domain-containing protein [Gammaproteobacteria bacterium]|nr:DUF1488 domain-containing protein [Gammaproteobacteria bacterium]
MSKVIFPPLEEEDDSEEVVHFEAIVNGVTIHCSVSYGVLSEFFDADYCDPLFAFMTGRSKIEEAVCKKLKNMNIDSDNTILINRDDIQAINADIES